MMNLHDTLLAFSEWLDGEGMMRKWASDSRTHDDLVSQFVGGWEGLALPGREEDGIPEAVLMRAMISAYNALADVADGAAHPTEAAYARIKAAEVIIDRLVEDVE